MTEAEANIKRRMGQQKNNGNARMDAYLQKVGTEIREGKGTYIWLDGSTYDGYFKDSKTTGFGRDDVLKNTGFAQEIQDLRTYKYRIQILKLQDENYRI